MQHKLHKNRSGFTLIELIIYISITTFVLISIVTFMWGVMDGENRMNVSNELTENGKVVFDKVTEKMRNAEDVVVGSSTFDTNPGVLVLDVGSENLTFDTYDKDVTVGGVQLTITKIRMQEGSDPAVDLTSDKVDVTDFTLKRRTRDEEAENIKMEISLDFVTGGTDLDSVKSLDLETAISIREK